MQIVKLSGLLVLFCTAFVNTQVFACSDVGQVQFVQIFEVGPSLVVVWQEPDNSENCELQYKVEYATSLNVQEGLSDELHYTFEYVALPCDLGQVSITPVFDDTVIEASIHSEDYGADIGAVTDIQFYEGEGLLRGTWSEPPNSELCEFVYVVDYTDESGSILSNTTGTEILLAANLTPCVNSTLTVTPTFGNQVGLSKVQQYEATVGLVTNFKLESVSGEVFAKFDPPVNTGRCNLTYEVSQIERNCFTKSVGAWAISNSGKEGIAISADIETEISAVGNLDVQLSNGIVEMSWTRPENTVDCFITYLAQFEYMYFEIDDTNMNFESELLPCQIATVAVWPVSSSGKLGIAANTTYERGIGAIINLELEMIDDKLTATWDVPEDWYTCVLSYLIEYDDGKDIHITVSEETSFSFVYDSCNAADITVTPHTASGLEGLPTYASFKKDCRQ